MSKDKELLKLRNTNIRKRFNQIEAKNPKWRYDAVIAEVSKEFYLTTRTIAAILNYEGTYGETG